MSQRLTFITVGQSPRSELIDFLMSHVDVDCDVTEFGALDGLAYKDIVELEPAQHEIGIATQLRDGRKVSISESWLRWKIDELCKGRGKTAADLTVIASTGVFDIGNSGEYVLHGQNSLDQLMEALVLSGLNVGKIFPLASQPDRQERSSLSFDIEAVASPGNEAALQSASNILRQCDILVLNSMGYTERDREIVMQYFDKPVVVVRKILAGKIASILKQSSQSAVGDKLLEGSILSNRLSKLTKRERQVFDNVVDGMGNKEIGRFLDISHRTVEIHRAKMLAKMGVSNSNELMRLIVQNVTRGQAHPPAGL